MIVSWQLFVVAAAMAGAVAARAAFPGDADLVTALPGAPVDLNLTMYAGMLNATSSPPSSRDRPAGSARRLGGQLFYWLCESPRQGAPLLLWLQGGPGASSLFGLFTENGPLRVASASPPQLTAAPFSWTDHASVLYLDQPFGTGYSQQGDNESFVTNERELRAAAVAALRSFVRRHPRFQSRDLYVFGESFAGHMAPNVVSQLLQDAPTLFRFRGLAIGDGWVDPVAQNVAFPDFAYAAGLIGGDQYTSLAGLARQCSRLIAQGNYTEAFDRACYYNLLDPIVSAAGGVDPYDIRRYAAPDSSTLTAYLGRSDVQDALHLPSSIRCWGCQSAQVEHALVADLNAPTSLGLWPAILQEGPILVYSGQFDLICNSLGTSRYLHSLQWPGAPAFHAANRSVWRVDGQVAGFWQEGGRLAHVVVSGAGHMAPADQPAACYEMVRQFVGQPSSSE